MRTLLLKLARVFVKSRYGVDPGDLNARYDRLEDKLQALRLDTVTAQSANLNLVQELGKKIAEQGEIKTRLEQMLS